MHRIIENNKFNFKKKYGQNFLVDENILKKIVLCSDIQENTLVIEIGVGSGNLTKEIAKVAKNVIGYEIDNNLEPINTKTLGSLPNVEIIYDDFLERDIASDIVKYEYDHLYVIANLPYYITTPIIAKLIYNNVKIDKMIIMVQKEVGERLSAKPDCKEYNSLTIFINYYFEVTKMFDVSKNVFVPRPNVDSSIIQLNRRGKKPFLNNEELFFKLIRDAFQFKRKTLKNNLKNYDLTKVAETLKKYDLDLTVRAEHLTIKQFIDIANNL